MNYKIFYKTILFLSIWILAITNLGSGPALRSLGIGGGVFVAQADTLDDLLQEIEQKEAEIEELRQEAQKFEQDIRETQQYADTISDQIANFNYEINRLQASINLKEREVQATQLAIQRIVLEIEKSLEDISRKKTQITAVIQSIYKNDEVSLIELLLKNDEFSNFYDQVQAREILQQSVGEDLEELKQFKVELEKSKVTLNGQEQELRREQSILGDQRMIINRERGRQKDLLTTTREQEWRYQNLLEEIRTQQAEVLLEIFRIEDELRQTLDPSSIPSARRGLLEWPSEGILTQLYGCVKTSWARRAYPPCDNGSGGFHNGLDIATAFGTPLVAAENGRVIAIENSPYAYGLWLAIEHSNGLVTLYTHMSLSAASIGKEVKRGEVVGYMGSSGFSTGSHVHFMVYAPDTFTTKPSKIAGILPIGATLNPFDYLN